VRICPQSSSSLSCKHSWIQSKMKSPSEFRYFPEHNNGNQRTINGCLIGQPTASKGDTFHFNKFSMYMTVSLYLKMRMMQRKPKISLNILKDLPLQCMLVTMRASQKLRECFFPPSLKETIELREENEKTSNINLP
jgi:hypothetical protein